MRIQGRNDQRHDSPVEREFPVNMSLVGIAASLLGSQRGLKHLFGRQVAGQELVTLFVKAYSAHLSSFP